MRVLLAFALLLGFSLTTTASAADWNTEPSDVECFVSPAADVTPEGADAFIAVSSAPTEEMARDCVLVLIIDYFDGDGNYLGSDYFFEC